jgi:hypothetical protein
MGASQKGLSDMNSIERDSYRTITGGVLGHQNILGIRTSIITTYLLLFSPCILLFLPIDTVARLGEEEGPVENAGALSFLFAATIFLVTAYRSSEQGRQCGANHIESPLALYALGALLLVCFGEEISWGQGLFHYPVPAWLKALNLQGEWNLHNLVWFHAQTVEGAEKSFWARLIDMQRLLAIFQLTLCTLVPMLTAYSATIRTWTARVGIPIVPWWIAGLMPVHFLVSQTLYAISGDQQILGNTLDETKETVRAFIFLVVAIWAYIQIASTSVSAGVRPSHAASGHK